MPPVGPPAPDSQDEEVLKLKSLWRQQEIRHNIWSYQARERALDWNHKADVLIFFTVILIVVSGLVLSAVQFYIALVAARTGAVRAATPEELPNSPARTPVSSSDGTSDSAAIGPVHTLQQEVIISKERIQVKSSVLGVVILVVSLAFFYLYLDRVYPIAETPASGEATETSR
jgi:hypothetical protein